jgi:site-specific recombinase XerD
MISTFIDDGIPQEHKGRQDIELDYLRRSNVLVVCGSRIDEAVKNDIAIAERYRIPATKSYLHCEMTRGTKKSGIKRIRVHDLRHSHASMLIEEGFSALLISERLGHESIETTLQTYSHLYPNKQIEVANRLDQMRQNPRKKKRSKDLER